MVFITLWNIRNPRKAEYLREWMILEFNFKKGCLRWKIVCVKWLSKKSMKRDRSMFYTQEKQIFLLQQVYKTKFYIFKH